MKQSLFLSALLLSVSTLFYGCGSSNTKQSSSPSQKEDQTTQTSADVKGYSIDNGILTSAPTPTAIGSIEKKLMAIYMVGSDLETNGEAGTNDLKELITGYNALSNDEKDKLDVVVAFGGSDKDGWRGMRIATITQLLNDADDEIFGNLENVEYEHISPDAHMGDASSLNLFLKYLKDGYADDGQKILTMWDHGSAYGSFGNDSNYDGDGLTMAETDSALTTVGLKFDIIGYDACLNANFELASITQKHATYHIGSEELEPGHGWNYTAVISALAKNSDLEVYGKEIIDNYVKHDSHEYQSDGKTLSMVNLEKYSELKTAVDALATYVNSNLSDEDVKKAVIQAAVEAQQYGKAAREDATITIDLKGFSDGIATQLPDTVKSALTTAYLDYVVYAKNDGTRPNSNGVSIVPPKGYDDYNEAVSSSTEWYAMTRSMMGIISGDSDAPTISAQNTSTDGAYATFSDSNLASVKTVYGNIITESDGSKYFASVATLPAEKTSNAGEYFTPKWNQEWYIMYFGDSVNDNSWLSMEFENTYIEDSVTYKTYSADIEYVEANKSYAKYPSDQKYDYAKLTITVNESQEVQFHSIRPYKIVHQSAEDTTGSILYDKASHKLKAGDKIKLLAEYFNMKTFDTEWLYESDLLTITKEPTFELEKLVFDDDNGKVLDYYYMMIGTDIAGNWMNTDPVKAQ